MSVLTVLNCGTNFDASSADLIASLPGYLSGKRGWDWLIFAGPGSPALSSKDYNPLSTEIGLVPLRKALHGAADHLTGMNSELLYRAQDLALGVTGMHANVRFLMEHLHARGRELPRHINMIGWSRGACTCVLMANEIAKTYKDQISIDIYAIDPVAGPTNLEDTSLFVLPKNVKACGVVYMENESRPMMNGVSIRAESEHTKLAASSFPGIHGTPVSLRPSSIETPVSAVVAQVVMNFLRKRGVLRKDPDLPGDDVTCSAFAQMILHQPYYLGLGCQTRLLHKGSWKEHEVVTPYLLRKGYFVNKMHKACFKWAFPKLYEYLFGDPAAPLDVLLARLYRPQPWTAPGSGVLADWRAIAEDIRVSLLAWQEIKHTFAGRWKKQQLLQPATKPGAALPVVAKDLIHDYYRCAIHIVQDRVALAHENLAPRSGELRVTDETRKGPRAALSATTERSDQTLKVESVASFSSGVSRRTRMDVSSGTLLTTPTGEQVGASLSAESRYSAGVSGKAEARLQIDAQNDGLSVEAKGQAKAFSGVEAQQTGSLTLGPFQIRGTVKEQLGVGAEARGELQWTEDKAVWELQLGLVVGLGVTGGLRVEYDPGAMSQMFVQRTSEERPQSKRWLPLPWF